MKTCRPHRALLNLIDRGRDLGLACAVLLQVSCGGEGLDAAADAGSDDPDGLGSGSGGNAVAPVDSGLRTVTWCQAQALIDLKCLACHANPPAFETFPLVTFADTRADYHGKPVWWHMGPAIESDYMPYLRSRIEATPLTAQEKQTFLTWLGEGATDHGGTDCAER